MVCAVCWGLSSLAGCGRESEADDTDGTSEAVAGGQGDDDAGIGPRGSDPLLAEARAALGAGAVGGQLPDDVQARIVASEDPAHARARRILLAMDGASAAELGLDTGADVGEVPSERSAELGDAEAGDATGETTTKPPGTGVEGTSNRDGPVEASPSAGPRARDDGPALAVITTVDLEKRGGAVELVIKAASSVKVGTAAQLEEGTLRYVLPSTGALPSALRARPSVKGVKIVDVRRGEDTVQIAVQLDQGWRAKAPRSTASGAKIRFEQG